MTPITYLLLSLLLLLLLFLPLIQCTYLVSRVSNSLPFQKGKKKKEKKKSSSNLAVKFSALRHVSKEEKEKHMQVALKTGREQGNTVGSMERQRRREKRDYTSSYMVWFYPG